MLNKDLVIAGVGAVVVGLIGWRMGVRLSKTIDGLQVDVLKLERRLLEIDIKALDTAKTQSVEQRESFVKEILEVYTRGMSKSRRMLLDGGNDAIGSLRHRFVDGTITFEEFVKDLLDVPSEKYDSK